MNKRGTTISFEMIMWIPRFVYLVVVMLSIYGIIFAYISTTVNVAPLESQIIFNRLHFSPDGISRYDAETGRVYTGVVDSYKITDSLLSDSIGAGGGELAARIVMYGFDDNPQASAFLNRDTYLDWQPIAIVAASNQRVGGSGRKTPYFESRYAYSGSFSRVDGVVISGG